MYSDKRTPGVHIYSIKQEGGKNVHVGLQVVDHVFVLLHFVFVVSFSVTFCLQTCSVLIFSTCRTVSGDTSLSIRLVLPALIFPKTAISSHVFRSIFLPTL